MRQPGSRTEEGWTLRPRRRGTAGGLLGATFLLLLATASPGAQDEASPSDAASSEISIRVTDDLLLVPVRNGAPKVDVSLLVGDDRVRRFKVALASSLGEASFWSYVDLRPFEGQDLRVVARGPEPRRVILIRQGDRYSGQDELYRETYRPLFHFTSRRGWNNDPNGLVYYGGEWHLFYQHNPVGWSWDNMHWGHAASDDLVHWRELGDVLFPWSEGVRGHVFSGSGFVDWKNTAGFQTGDDAPLVVAFTDTGTGESLAYSNDGRTFSVYEGNPVVVHSGGGRDPKIVWHEPTGRWVMAVYDETEGRSIDFHSSANLREWRFESRLPGFFECPELLKLPIEGGSGSRWIVFAGDGQYVLGSFDGRTFVPEHEGKHTLWYGNFYASQVYSDAPDDRWIQVGWAKGNDYPGMPFNQGMTVPVELSLRQTSDGPRLFAVPVPELQALRRDHTSRPATDLAAGDDALEGFEADVFEIEALLQLEEEAAATLSFGGVKIRVDAAKGTLRCGFVEAPLFRDADGRVRLHILVDRGSVEVFASEGRIAISEGGLLPPGPKPLSLSASGPARLLSFDLWELASIWE